MRDITVLVTASGAPGTAALLRALRQNGERGVRIVGTDMSPQAIGRHFCDAFYVVPPGGDAAFADAVLDLATRESVDAVLPQSSFDLLGLAEARERFTSTGIAVLVSPPETIRRANDKAEAYALLHRIGVPAPAWRRVTGGRALAAAAVELGYPERPVCFKPVFSSGSRGFRVLDPTVEVILTASVFIITSTPAASSSRVTLSRSFTASKAHSCTSNTDSMRAELKSLLTAAGAGVSGAPIRRQNSTNCDVVTFDPRAIP